MVLRQGLILTGSGIVGGLLGAAALTRVMASLLFGVSAGDLVTFSSVPLLLLATAMFASYIPVFVFHGTDDANCPVQGAIDIATRARDGSGQNR